MKDTILASYVHNFSDQYDLGELTADQQFEHFINYSVISKQYPRNFEFEDASLGGGDDIGLDGAAIVVNGIFVTSPEQVTELAKRNGYLDVNFYLIQSKSSSKFSGEQVATFVFGVKSLFDEKSSMPENALVKNLRAIKKRIFELSIQFISLPTLNMYFVTTGKWEDPDAITGRANRDLVELKQKKLFASLDLHFLDADKIKEMFRELQRRVVKEVKLEYQTALPDMDGVTRSFLGALPAKDFVKLLTDDEGNLQKSLFYDNVRDFQGKNRVNDEIYKTLVDPVRQNRLALLNNGVTLIAKQIEQIGNKLKLSDFQIVNGCQTSNLIFEHREKLSSGTFVPIKIIETNDQDIITDVIEATNSQTEVKREAFESLRPFHKDLEEYYNARSKTEKFPIFYERRSKQYQHLPSIKAHQVISLSIQIKTFVSAFLKQPHSTHRYYGELLESYNGKLFVDGHAAIGYYVSAVLYHQINHLFELRKIDGKYRVLKFQIILAVSEMFVGLAAFKGKDFEKKCEDLIALCNDRANLLAAIKMCCGIIDAGLTSSKLAPHIAVRSKDFTNLMIHAVRKGLMKKAA
ncbi:MAG: AIPR family protein [Pseudomonadota bacterium]